MTLSNCIFSTPLLIPVSEIQYLKLTIPELIVLQCIWHYVQVQLPGYLKSLPIPTTVGGFAELTRDQWLQLVPFFLFLFVLLYLLFSPFVGMVTSTKQRRPRVNRRQKLNEKKVVNMFDMEDLDKMVKEKNGKVAYCRCWKSATVCM